MITDAELVRSGTAAHCFGSGVERNGKTEVSAWDHRPGLERLRNWMIQEGYVEDEFTQRVPISAIPDDAFAPLFEAIDNPGLGTPPTATLQRIGEAFLDHGWKLPE